MPTGTLPWYVDRLSLQKSKVCSQFQRASPALSSSFLQTCSPCRACTRWSFVPVHASFGFLQGVLILSPGTRSKHYAWATWTYSGEPAVPACFWPWKQKIPSQSPWRNYDKYGKVQLMTAFCITGNYTFNPQCLVIWHLIQGLSLRRSLNIDVS